MTTISSRDSADPRWGSENRPQKAEVIWQALVTTCGPQIAEGGWLDVGCGSGGIAATLASRVKKITGLDPEPWACWPHWMSEFPNLELIQGGYDTSPAAIPPESVDVVICNQVYEHVQNPMALIAFIHRSLRPGGYCYFAGPNLLFPIEPHVFWPCIHWLPRPWALALMRRAKARYLIDAHSVSYWTLLRWLRIFEVENALPDILKHPDRYGRSGWFWKVLSYLPARAIESMTPLSPGFIFVLRKQARRV